MLIWDLGMVNLRWEHAPAALSPFSSVLSMHQFDALFDCLGLIAWIAWIHGSFTLPFELIWASVSISLGAMRRKKAFFLASIFCRFLQFPTLWGDMVWHGKQTQAFGWTCVSCGCTRWSFRNPSRSRANLSQWMDQHVMFDYLIHVPSPHCLITQVGSSWIFFG